MTFRTIISTPAFPFRIGYEHRILLMGSCFSDHIGKRLTDSRFLTRSNPLGIVFNPLSLARQFDYLFDPGLLDFSDWKKNDGLWHHFDFHGQFSGPDLEEVHRVLLSRLESTAAFLKGTDYLFLTFGTASVFRWKGTGRVVANNHKFPIGDFTRDRLSPETIQGVFIPAIEKLKNINPALRVILTLSPVRYTREGLIENQRSKASLVLAIDELCRATGAFYFPSYEIFTDDLRDYRFYANDLVHPGDQGIEYTWEIFRKAFFEEKTLEVLSETERLVASTRHRPIHPGSDLHQRFIRKLMEDISQFMTLHPGIDFTVEMEKLKSQLINGG